MYCVNCGVKLADTEKRCPLCQTMVFHPEVKQGEGEPLYPRPANAGQSVNSRTVHVVIATAFLLAMFISLAGDLQMGPGLTWSGYVIGGLLLSYVVILLPMWFRDPNPVIFVPCDFAAVGLYLLYINLAVGGQWFLRFAFPVTGAVGMIVTAVVTLMRYIRRGRLYIFGGAFIAFGAFMPVMELLLCITFPHLSFIGWCFYPLIAMVLIGGMLIFLAISSRARETMERKFFI